jgi:hypothetical protein
MLSSNKGVKPSAKFRVDVPAQSKHNLTYAEADSFVRKCLDAGLVIKMDWQN